MKLKTARSIFPGNCFVDAVGRLEKVAFWPYLGVAYLALLDCQINGITIKAGQTATVTFRNTHTQFIRIR